MARLAGPLDVDDIFLIQTTGPEVDGKPTGEWRHVSGAGAGAVPLGSFGEAGPTGPAFEGRSSQEVGFVGFDSDAPQLIFDNYRARRAIVVRRDGGLDDLLRQEPVHSCYVLGSRSGELQLPTDGQGNVDLEALRRQAEKTVAANPLIRVGLTGVLSPRFTDTPWPRPTEDYYTNAAAKLRTLMTKWSYDRTPPSFVAVVGPGGALVACDPGMPYEGLRAGAEQVERALGNYRLGTETGRAREPARFNETQLHSVEFGATFFGLTQLGMHSLLYTRDSGTGTALVVGNLADAQRGFSLPEAWLVGDALTKMQSNRHPRTGLAIDAAGVRLPGITHRTHRGPVSVIEFAAVDLQSGDGAGESDNPEGWLRYARAVERVATREPEQWATVHPATDSLGVRFLVYVAADSAEATALEGRLRDGIEAELRRSGSEQIRFVSDVLELEPDVTLRTIEAKLAKLDGRIDDKIKLLQEGVAPVDSPAPPGPRPSRATRRPPRRPRGSGPRT